MAKKRKNSHGKNKSKSPVIRDIVFVGLLALCFLMFISVIGAAGIVGKYLGSFLFGMFGVGAYIFPIYGAFLVVCIFFAPYRPLVSISKLVLSGIAFIFVCMFMHLLFSSEPKGIIYPFLIGFNDHVGGGIIGGGLAYLALVGVGTLGAYIINILAFIILLILFAQKSFLSLIPNKGDKKPKTKKKTSKIIDDERFSDDRVDELIDIIDKSQEPVLSVTHLDEEPKPERVVKRQEHTISGIDFNAFVGETLTKSTPLQPLDEPVATRVNHIVLDPIDDDAPSPVDEGKEIPESKIIEKSETIDSINIEPVKMEPVDTETEIIEPADIKLEISETINSEPEDSYVPGIEDISETEDSYVPELENNHISEPEMVVTPEPEDVSEPEDSYIPESEHITETEDNNISEFADVSDAVAVSDINTTIDNNIDASFDIEEESRKEGYIFPDLNLLTPAKNNASEKGTDNTKTGERLISTLSNFGVNATLSDISIGPTVTRFEIIPDPGTKVSKITNLSDDIKLNLAVEDIRIEAPIPGKSAVGIEVPNKEAVVVSLRELLSTDEFKNNSSPLVFGAGKDIGGNCVISDIAKMPHVLIAGATGSGKSVCINTIIMSILYKASPDEIKFIMIDPKVVELNVYNSIPHLLIPVVSDPKKAAGALNWAVREMNDRYQKFAALNVRDLSGYNKKIMDADPDIYPEAGKKLPRIVVIVDELADLMMVAKSEVEESICRLAQLARACGIHLVIATQRPSVDVITGLIKANMPSRIAFAVTSGVDSRTILDQNGAEKLLGKGDMLYFPQGLSKPIRVQGAFVSDDEVFRVVEYISEKNTKKDFSEDESEDIQQAIELAAMGSTKVSPQESFDDGRDDLFEAAARFIIEKEKGSIGLLQRQFRIGFNRAARIMDQLAVAGIVGPEEGTKPRKVIITLEEFENNPEFYK